MRIALACLVGWAAISASAQSAPEAPAESAVKPVSVRGPCIKSAYVMDRGVEAFMNRIGSFFGDAEPRFERLSDTGRPNKVEREAIRRLGIEVDRCLNLDDPVVNALHPSIRALVDQVNLSTRLNLAALVSGKLTYGEYYTAQSEGIRRYNTSLDGLIAEAKAREAQEEQQRQAAARAAQQRAAMEEASARARAEQERNAAEYSRKMAELEERQRQIDNSRAFTNGLMLFQQSLPRPAPMAPSISCTSRNSFGTVYTDCR